MEGDDSGSDDDDFVSTQRKRPKLVEKKKEEKVVKAGPSTSATKSKPATTETPASAPPKHLAVEMTRLEGCDEGELNPRGTADKEKRKLVTASSTAREDQAFRPMEWKYVPRVEEMDLDDEEERPIRDGRGIVIREGELKEEFQNKYTGTADSKVGAIVKDEGVDKIRKTILRLVGLAPDETISPDLGLFEASPEPTLTQEEQGLTAGQREALFKEILAKPNCGRVAVDDKPGWFLIIHKAPTTGLIHLCLERLTTDNRVSIYVASRLCTARKCYQYIFTLASDVLPKCKLHQPEPTYTVMEVTDYRRRGVLVLLHLKMVLSVDSDAADQNKEEVAELFLGRRCACYTSWKEYSDSRISFLSTKGLKGKGKKEEDDKNRPIAKSISRHHFTNEEDALKRLSFESTIGMFMKLAPGTQPIINLDDLIPLCYGKEGEIDARLKELGMELKIRRHLTPEERADKEKTKYPFIGEYFLTTTLITTPTTTVITTATPAAALQQPEKEKTFLYAIMSRDMHYFGWSATPDFKTRLNSRGTDGARDYKRITEKRQKDRELEIEGLKQRDRELGRAEELCTYPPPIKAPTLTCYLLAKCDDDEKGKKKTKTIEAKMIIAGYVAYLLGFRNPIRPNSFPCYSTNKCVSLSLVDSTSWGEICDFVKFFWGFEPMLGKFEGN